VSDETGGLPSEVAEKTEASETEAGVLVKVTFANGMSKSFEVHCVGAVELIMQIGRVLDKHREKMLNSEGNPS
jgi:hypothetical protein